jgi:hypothetical protein
VLPEPPGARSPFCADMRDRPRRDTLLKQTAPSSAWTTSVRRNLPIVPSTSSLTPSGPTDLRRLVSFSTATDSAPACALGDASYRKRIRLRVYAGASSSDEDVRQLLSHLSGRSLPPFSLQGLLSATGEFHTAIGHDEYAPCFSPPGCSSLTSHQPVRCARRHVSPPWRQPHGISLEPVRYRPVELEM